MRNKFFLVLLSCLTFSVCSQNISIDEIIRLTIDNNPQLLMEKENILSAKADLLLAQSEFDSNWVFFGNTTKDNTPLQASNIPFYSSDQVETDYITYGINHSKKLSNGMTISNELKFERTYDNSTPTPGEKSNSSIVLSLDIPLLAGSGNISSFQKQAAYLAYKAQICDYEYSVSSSVSDAISLYWKCVGTGESLEILKKSVESMEQIKEDTQRLIKVNEAPGAELKKVETGLASRISQKISGETDYFQCTNNIGLITGMAFSDFSEIKPENTSYPIPQEFNINDIDVKKMIETAMENRKDIQAARLRLEAAQKLMEYARDNMKNNVSLEIKADVKGLSEGSDAHSLTKAWSDNKSDASYSATLKRIFSGSRDNARNAYMKSMADMRKAEIAYKEKRRNAMSEISVMYRKFAGEWQKLEKMKQAVEFSEFSLDAEKKKLKLGMTTVLDVINVEDNHNSTYLNYIQTKVEFINTAVEFAKVCGTLIDKRTDGKLEIKDIFGIVNR